MPHQTRHIAFFLPTFPAGGQEHTTLLLMKGLVERGHRVDLLLERKVGAYLPRVPDSIQVHELKRRSRWSGYRRFITGWPSGCVSKICTMLRRHRYMVVKSRMPLRLETVRRTKSSSETRKQRSTREVH